MLALCVEASHQRGMGHFFRALNFFRHVSLLKQRAIFLINEHEPSLALLQNARIPFDVVRLDDLDSGWETGLIRKYGVTFWINDRLDTDSRHAQHVKHAGIPLATFDDRGSGAELADFNIAALVFDDVTKLAGQTVLHGTDYLILNSEIAGFRRPRIAAGKIVVSMGGSDTHGVTAKVVRILRDLNKAATLILGPGHQDDRQLDNLGAAFTLKRSVPSLIEEFSKYDLAITGGGITPFEANASGLPCVVVACEPFEADVGKTLEQLGSSVFAGMHNAIDASVFAGTLDIGSMSRHGLTRIPMNGAENISRALGLV